MAFGSFLRRRLLPLLLTTALVACSADGLVPPGRIDNSTRVSAIAPAKQTIRNRTNNRQTYPAADMPMGDTGGDAGGNVDYLNTPNLSGTGHQASRPATAMAEGRTSRLPMIDSEEAAVVTGNSPGTSMGVQPLGIPSGGVNMDRDLGVAPVTGLAQEQAAEIAEGGSTQPVVDGVGFENPTQMPQAELPQSELQQQVEQAPAWGDQSRVTLPRKARPVRSENDGQQVAFLSRPGNPMSLPDESNVMPASERACRSELKRLGVIFSDLPRIDAGPSCGIPYPIELQGLGGVQVSPATTLNCQVTLAFAKWVKYELVPSARLRYWSGVKTIIPLGGYSCRRMNSSARNPWSEHARGNAIDVGKFILNSGKQIDVRKKGFFAFREKGLLKAVRSDSCRYFHTVLGPGSDPFHKDHFHFDLRTRKSGYRYCD